MERGGPLVFAPWCWLFGAHHVACLCSDPLSRSPKELPRCLENSCVFLVWFVSLVPQGMAAWPTCSWVTVEREDTDVGAEPASLRGPGGSCPRGGRIPASTEPL